MLNAGTQIMFFGVIPSMYAICRLLWEFPLLRPAVVRKCRFSVRDEGDVAFLSGFGRRLPRSLRLLRELLC